MQAANRPRVLLVISDQEEAAKAKLRCEQEGFEVLTAQSFEEAFRTARERRPAIVISDLAGESGRALVKGLRESFTAPIVFVLTGGVSFPEKDAYALGASACFRRPVDLDALVAALRHFHREAELKRDLLRELDAAKRNFDAKVPVSAVAHELMNPLMVLRGTLSSIIRKLGRTETKDQQALQEVLKLSELAFRSAERIVRLLKGLRTLSTESRGAEMETVDLQAVAKETVRAMQEEFSAIPIDWHLDIDPGDYHVNAATGTAELILANLTKNAAEAVVSRPHPRVKVKLERRNEADGERVVVRVEDNGIGVPLDWSSRVFEALTTTKRHLGGTGLGLYLCREAAFRLGGTISLVSPARPTAFEMVLPARRELCSVD